MQNTEKVSHVVTVTARGPGGHASIPLAGNAILRLGRALEKISAYKEPVQVNPTTREFFSELGRVWPAAVAARLRAPARQTIVAADAPLVSRPPPGPCG